MTTMPQVSTEPLKTLFGPLKCPIDIRDVLLRIRSGSIHFNRLPADDLEELIRRGYVAKPADCPDPSVFLAFMREDPCVTAHGFAACLYAQHMHGSVVIEGIALHSEGCVDPRSIRDFIRFAKANKVGDFRFDDGGLLACWD